MGSSVLNDLLRVVDAFNRGINPIIQTVGIPFENDLRSIREDVNRDITAFINKLNTVIPPTFFSDLRGFIS